MPREIQREKKQANDNNHKALVGLKDTVTTDEEDDEVDADDHS